MNKKHGYTKTHQKLYYVWHAMKKRCNDKANKNYGGRGISYCKEWESSEAFCEWALTNGYTEGLELDRIDTNGNYEPSNCRWVDRKSEGLPYDEDSYIEWLEEFMQAMELAFKDCVEE